MTESSATPELRTIDTEAGTIGNVAGPVVKGINMRGCRMYDVVQVSDERLIGEIIELDGDKATIQVYEETDGVTPGGPIYLTNLPLSVELGPGLIGKIYDGIQRPLPNIKEVTGDFIGRGVHVSPIEHDAKWKFTPLAMVGDKISGGDFLGEVPETTVVMHKIMTPPDVEGEVTWIAPAGEYTLEESIAKVKLVDGTERELTMAQKWPVRRGRPFKKKFDPEKPLITGQRILDTFFPIAKGGTAAIPGGFGTGKTITQHQLAKWCDAEIIVYVGCGERGNEMTEVLQEFPELLDPRTGQPLMNRTILIANTSNMPVAAREASVYTGITLAEYYRDMGYNVALMADSTSRWAEAMREISGRLEEMPGEEGYPAYLASRLADFYERAGFVDTIHSDDEQRDGSISVIGAVSPPGGDFSEPVTQNTLRIVKVFWALDADLADRRHFPSINWLRSYSLYLDQMVPWWSQEVSGEWPKLRERAMVLLQKEAELQEIVQLVGPDALPPKEQVDLEGARVIRENFLQQNAFHKVDTYCPPKKQVMMLNIMLDYYDMIQGAASKGVSVERIKSLKCREPIGRMATASNEKFQSLFTKLHKEMREEVRDLTGGGA